jgi:magnesium chelatase subunit I
MFLRFFVNPNKLKKSAENDPYGVIKAFFAGGNEVELLNDASDKDFKETLNQVAGLETLVADMGASKADVEFLKELMIYGLSELEVVNKDFLGTGSSFSDPLADMWDDLTSDDI